MLGKPIGKQDQYAAAFGGLQLLEFGPGSGVRRTPLVLTEGQAQALGRNLLMFHTGRGSSGEPLERLNAVAGEPETVARLEQPARRRARAIRRAVRRSRPRRSRRGDARELAAQARAARRHRRRDRRLVRGARAAGAIGGKLLGSGSGGFLLVYVPVERQAEVRRALGDLREFAFAPETEGTRIIYVGR